MLSLAVTWSSFSASALPGGCLILIQEDFPSKRLTVELNRIRSKRLTQLSSSFFSDTAAEPAVLLSSLPGRHGRGPGLS